MSFDKEKDLEETKAYYVDLGKSGPMFFTHTSKWIILVTNEW